MGIESDGSYEIVVSREKPAKGNWMKLEDGASQITTRHYHESRHSIGTVPGTVIPIDLEVIDPQPLSPNGGDESVANHLEWVANFVRAHAAMPFHLSPPATPLSMTRTVSVCGSITSTPDAV